MPALAPDVLEVMRLQRLAGNRAVAPFLQRRIVIGVNAQNGIEVNSNAKRGRFTALIKRQFPTARPPNNPGPAQNISHLIPFAVIQQDLVLVLRNALAQPNTVMIATDFDHIIDPLLAGQPRSQTLTTALGTLLAHFGAVRVAARGRVVPAARVLTTAATSANALLNQLNNTPGNLRVGNASRNQSLQHAIDADFVPGLHAYAGNVQAPPGRNPFVVGPAAHAAVIPVPRRQPTQAGGGNVIVRPQAGQVVEGVRLVPAHESIVFQYASRSGADPGFTINGHAPPGQAATNNRKALRGQHLSSGTMPNAVNAVTPHPVIVFDARGTFLPLVFGT